MTDGNSSSETVYGLVRHFHNPAAAAKDVDYGSGARSVISLERFAAAMEEISSWTGYQPTPLVSLPGLAFKANIAGLYYKDEGFRFGLDSFKALGGAYATERLLMERIRQERPEAEVTVDDLLPGRYGDITAAITVACATDGNHGRSVAWGARMFGCKCIIYIHADVSEGRKQAMESYGAEVRRVDGDYDESVRQAARDAEEKGWYVVSDTSYEGYLDVPRDVMQGYTVMVEEALQQLPEGVLPTHVFLQGGVGGLAGAVCGHLWETLGERRPRFIVVEPERADCLYQSAMQGRPTPASGDLETMMAGLSCGEISLIAWEILATGTDDFVTIPDTFVAPTMRLLATGVDSDTPIAAGESAIAGVACVLDAAEDPNLARALGLDSRSRVLIFGTEGATDPDIYKQIVGKTAEQIRAG